MSESIPEDDCDHVWEYVPDWMGDSSIPNGTIDCSHYECLECGLEQVEEPEDYIDDRDGPDEGDDFDGWDIDVAQTRWEIGRGL